MDDLNRAALFFCARIFAFSACAALVLPAVTTAQTSGTEAQDSETVAEEDQPALLVADRVYITADRRLIAEGNVEAFQGDTRLRANRIEFDRDAGTLKLNGPMRIDQGQNSTILADYAELDEGFQNGLLTGARLVFNQHLQLSALQMTRVRGRYSQLYKTSVTSCHVCEDGRPPIWQIRAGKITHDQLEGQFYLEEAQFRILGVPVFYFPGMRLPDPTLKRASGFLIPSVRTTSHLNTGVKVPYFFKLGDHKDLTLTPYLSSKTRTLEYRYRQAFRTGRIEFEGAYTRDDLEPDQDRGYLFATGKFDLPDDFKLAFDVKLVSDDAYLVDYGLPDLDRLRSEIAIGRSKRDEYLRASLIHYKTLRDGENEDFLPSNIAFAEYEQRFFPTQIGGELRLGLYAQAHRRNSTTDVLGRDMSQATVDFDWRRKWIFGNGLVADWQIGTAMDAFGIYDDSTFPTQVTRVAPRTAVTLSMPMSRHNQSGAVHYLEPVVQLGWTDVTGDAVPNDSSNFVEFDQGNLLALSRFPGNDQREDGASVVYGVNWSRFKSESWTARATIGQVFRDKEDPRFTQTSGLSGTSSDLLLAGQLALTNGISVSARGLMDGSFKMNKTEIRGDWVSDTVALSGTYLWLDSDLGEDRADPISELWFDGSYVMDTNWTARANVRYDLEASRASRAGFGLAYQNECLTIDLTLERNFSSSTSVEPTTDFGFTVSLNGFAVDGNADKYRRSCKHT
ncbi:MAG: LPS-assembly protein LptD [Paracoccaceae bacterium]